IADTHLASAPIAAIRSSAPHSEGVRAWRAGVARWTLESIAHGERGERADGAEPAIPFDAALATLGDRLEPLARRALILLYGAWPGVDLTDAMLEARLHDAALVIPSAGADLSGASGNAGAIAIAALAARGGDALVIIDEPHDAGLPAALAALPMWTPPL